MCSSSAIAAKLRTSLIKNGHRTFTTEEKTMAKVLAKLKAICDFQFLVASRAARFEAMQNKRKTS